jgi:protein-disulfide isomerase
VYAGTGKVRFEFKNFAFLTEESTFAAEGTFCAADQDAFWPYHDVVFGNPGTYSKSELKRLAEVAGLDGDAFGSCLDSGTYAQAVQDQLNEGRAKGVTSTPTILVNGTKVVGAQPFEAFEQLIEEELAKAGG